MNQPAYLETNLPVPEQVQDLLSRLTLDEKVAMRHYFSAGNRHGCHLGQGLDPPDRHCHKRRGPRQIPRSASSQRLPGSTFICF
jgi:hypothetical protein